MDDNQIINLFFQRNEDAINGTAYRLQDQSIYSHFLQHLQEILRLI